MTATKPLTVTLPAHWVEMIEARVAAGEFASADAFILARLEDEEAEPDWTDAEREAIDQTVRDTVERLDAGTEPLHPLDEVFTRLKARLQARIQTETPRAARA